MGEQTQDVLINLRLGSDRSNAGITSRLADDVEKMHARIESAATKSGAASAKAAQKSAAETLSAGDRMAAGMGQAWDKIGSANAKANDKMMAGFNRVATEAKKSADVQAAAAKSASDKEIAAAQKAADDKIAADERAARTRGQISMRATMMEMKERDRAATSVDRMEVKLERLDVRQVGMAKHFMAASAEMAEGFAKVGEGAVLLGIATEEDAKKMAKMFAAAKGIHEIFSGTLKVMLSAVEAQEALHRLTLAIGREEKVITALKVAQATANGTGAIGKAEGAGLGMAGEIGGTVAGGALATKGGSWLGKLKGLFGGGAASAAEGAAGTGLMGWLKYGGTGLGAGSAAGKIAAIGGKGLGFGAYGLGLGAAGVAGAEGIQGLRRGASYLTGGRSDMDFSLIGRHGDLGAKDEHGNSRTPFAEPNSWTGRSVHDRNDESPIGAVISAYHAMTSSAESEEDTKKHEEDDKLRKERMEKLVDVTKKKAELDKQIREINRSQAIDDGPARADKKLERERAYDEHELAAAKQAVTDAKKENDSAHDRFEARNLELEAVAYERQKEALERIHEAHQKNTEELEKQVSSQREQIAADEEHLAELKKATKEASMGFEDAKAKFAKLTEGEKSEIVRIGKKAKSGQTLTKAESLFLEKSGVGEKAAHKSLAGSVTKEQSDALKALGEGDKLAKAKKEEYDAIQDYIADMEELGETQTALKEAQDEVINSAKELAAALREITAAKGTKEGITVDTSGPAGFGGAANAGDHTDRDFGNVEAAVNDVDKSIDGTTDAVARLTDVMTTKHQELKVQLENAIRQMQQA